jgi:hypothetical protein
MPRDDGLRSRRGSKQPPHQPMMFFTFLMHESVCGICNRIVNIFVFIRDHFFKDFMLFSPRLIIKFFNRAHNSKLLINTNKDAVNHVF